MIRRLLLAVMLLLPLLASAATGDIVPITKWRIGITQNSVTTYYYTPADYCAGYLASIGGTTWTCSNTYVVGTGTDQLNQTWAYTVTAPGGSPSNRSSNATAWCDPAYYVGPGVFKSGDVKNYCKVVNDPPPTCKPGLIYPDWFPASGNGVGFPVCTDQGCAGSVTQVHTCITLGSSGVRWCGMDVKLSGNLCNVATDNTNGTGWGAGAPSKPSGSSVPSSVPPTSSGGKSVPCPTGTVQGGFDQSGIPICIGTGSDPQNPSTPPPTTTKPPVTTNNADGSTTTKQDVVQTNSDGSTTTTTTTTTTAVDGSKTVAVSAVTSNSSSGGVGKQDTPNTDQMNLCKQNPNLSICRDSTVSGDCTAGIVCTGDAIQCATLRAAAAMQCQQKQNDDDLKASSAYTLGSSVMGGTDPSGSTLPSPSKATTVTMPGTLDQTGWLGGGSCFADKTVTVQGRTFVLPYSKACDYLIVLRLGLMVIASLVSFRIVRDAVLT